MSQRAYRACDCSNTWLIESVKKFIIFEFQVERYGM